MRLPSQLRLASTAPFSTTVVLPGSKSITNRAYMLAALATGESYLRGALHSDDTQVMTECLGQLGVRIERPDPNTVLVHGSGGQFAAPGEKLFAGNSGTTIRFVTASAALAPAGAEVAIDGVERMRLRPIGDLVDALRQLGVSAKSKDNGCPPVIVPGGGLRGGRCAIKGDVSSQYLSALLMAAPYAQKDVFIDVIGELVSKPYINITLRMMQDFGVEVSSDQYRTFTIPGRRHYTGRTYAIEPDASNASYFMAAAAVTGGTVKIVDLGTSSIQGDIAVVDVFERMGCAVTKEASSFTVTGPVTLLPIDLDASATPDMAQTIAVAACFASGVSRLTGLSTLRVKETDRIAAMATELRKIGATVEEGADFLVIDPTRVGQPAVIDTYDDHRMAMSFAVAGLRIPGLSIADPGCVAKTFPDFWNRWAAAFPGSVNERDLL